MPEREIVLQTACGALRGRENERCRMFFGVPFARAGRFRASYAISSQT